MKEVHVDEIISALEKLFIDANYDLSRNVVETLEKAIDKEESPAVKRCFGNSSRTQTWREMSESPYVRIQDLL